MRLTFTALGLTLDVSFGPEADDDEPYDSGYTASTPIGFVAAHEVPNEMPWV